VTWGERDRSALVRLPIVARDRDGREVSTPTIEFRLPDGSAHAHLLLAGIAQAMSAATPGTALDALLAATAAGVEAPVPGVASPATAVPSVPRSFRDVASALRGDRAAFEADGVFPAGMIDAVIERLET
jgi:glutamine synthetase